MLMPEDIHPEKSIYYLSGLILEEIQEHGKKPFMDVYENLVQHSRISLTLFFLCLDWLYVIDAAVINKDGEIELCSSEN